VAKQAKCDHCKITFDIREKNQTPLDQLECPYCHGPVTRVYPGCRYYRVKSEPVLTRK
jgi:Zn finger protein HypA/HybF involved in hydrogenase expression